MSFECHMSVFSDPVPISAKHHLSVLSEMIVNHCWKDVWSDTAVVKVWLGSGTKTTLLGVTIVVMAKTTANIGCWSFFVSKSDILLTHPSSLTSSQFNWIYWHGSIQYNIANYANYVTTTGGLCHFKVNMLIKRLMLSSSSSFFLTFGQFPSCMFTTTYVFV